MRKTNWQKLMDQYEYIIQDDSAILDALDAGDTMEYNELLSIRNAKTDAFIRMVLEVLGDELENIE
ncbi:MAG: hypothetical protein HUK00_09810 [Bacteroidaceae bacterium]|mgnify:CR=1 FL=1|nr:hypothetical protein [Bacteroidaceae bacterium]